MKCVGEGFIYKKTDVERCKVKDKVQKQWSRMYKEKIFFYF